MGNTHTRLLTEDDFRANETRRLQELAGLIRATGQTARQIADECHLDKRTVLRALRAEPLKSDATARLEFYAKYTITYGIPKDKARTARA